MSLQGMNHFTVLSDDLEETRKFYCDLLGFEIGARPNFPMGGYWLYVGDQPILHVIQRQKLMEREHRSGILDHMAFTATDLPGTAAKLDKAGVKWELRRLPLESTRGGLWQLFFDDPHGAKVEFDFDKTEPAPANYAG
jgi:catechol 2,3-dioxygenase-like lactoylglutathione lyase family enzyme